MIELRAHRGLHDEELAALGLDPASMLDVSVNVNPFGPSPAVAAAARAAPRDRYPDRTPDRDRLVAALGEEVVA